MLPFLKQLGHHQPADQALQTVIVTLCRCDDRTELLSIVDGHHSSQGVGSQLFQKRFCQPGVILSKQPFEFRGAGEGPSVWQDSRRIDRRIVAVLVFVAGFVVMRDTSLFERLKIDCNANFILNMTNLFSYLFEVEELDRLRFSFELAVL